MTDDVRNRVAARVELDNRICQVLAKLEVVSAGTIYSYSVIAAGGSFGSQEPRSGDSHPPHLEYARRYNEAKGDAERGKVIEDAEAVLSNLTKTPAPKDPSKLETPEQLRQRIVDDFTEVEAFIVALKTGASVSDVRKARKDAGRDPDRGYQLNVSPDAMTAVDRRDRVEKHLEEGMTIRGIALLLGVSPQTISNDAQALKQQGRRAA